MKPSTSPPRTKDRLSDALTALCAGSLALSLLLVIGMLALLGRHGLSYFWQRPVEEITLQDGKKLLGELHAREPIPPSAQDPAPGWRIQLKVGNRDISGSDFIWIEERRISSRTQPLAVVMLERQEWGPFYGRMVEIRRGQESLALGSESVWRNLPEIQRSKSRLAAEIRALEKGPLGDINYEIEQLTLSKRKADIERLPPAERRARLADIDRRIEGRRGEFDRLTERLSRLRNEWLDERLVLETVDGQRRELPIGYVIRALRPNQLGWWGSLKLFLDRGWEFLSAEPRESNTEGGIFPAIFGTVMMVFIMAFIVSPFGVLAAVYLREYAHQGPLVRMVRIAVNNLAGVPSIVFGMFGLGFFVYFVGGTLDRLFFPEALPAPTFGTGGILWAGLTLALLTVPVVIVAAEEGLAAVPRAVREGSLALGATQFETTWKIVVPAAAPGILTGMILAMARAAGEVAPLMIVGMVKLAPKLPIDKHPPFLHLERKFMHLGFHIFDVGFQSPNVEASQPLVFATALLLVGVVTLMNLLAIGLRNYLRRKYASAAV